MLIPSGTGTRYLFAFGAVAIACSLLLVLALRLGSWYSGELASAYNSGYQRSELEHKAQGNQKLVQTVQSARVVRDTTKKTVRAVQEKANAVTSTPASPGCSFTEYDLGLLNGTIEVGNSGVRVLGLPELPRAPEVH